MVKSRGLNGKNSDTDVQDGLESRTVPQRSLCEYFLFRPTSHFSGPTYRPVTEAAALYFYKTASVTFTKRQA